MILTLPCIICGRELKSAISRNEDGEPEWMRANQPYAGTTFSARGHYGSTVWDNLELRHEGLLLEINICDSCVLQKASEGLILHYSGRPQPTRWDVTTWDGEGQVWCEKCGRAGGPGHGGPDDHHDDWTPFDAE